jgi:hypothetical protein
MVVDVSGSRSSKGAMQMSLTFHPYKKESIAIVFQAGEVLEFCHLEVDEKVKGKRVALSLGVVERLTEMSLGEDERLAFANELYASLVNSLPLDKDIANGLNKLHKDGYPNAAEAIALTADFYQFQFDVHDLRRWQDCVNVHRSVLA